MLVRRVAELAAAVRYGGVRFFGFLDERGRELAEACMNREGAVGCFWGGFDGAGRWYLGHGCEEAPMPEAFPLTAVRITCWLPGRTVPTAGLPGHRDYLGALLGLGIERDRVGDILVDGASAICFLEKKIAQVVWQELTEVGRFTVQLEEVRAEECVGLAFRTEQLTVNVASLRLDAVLAALLRLSRSDAAAMITHGAVSVGHIVRTQPHLELQEQDILSIRGHGRYRVGQVGSLSKKGRLWLTIEKYQ